MLMANLPSMTNPPGQQLGTPTGGSSAGKSAKSKGSVFQILKDSFNRLSVASGVIGVIAAIYTWTVLGTSLSIKAAVTVGVIALVIASTCVGNLRKEDQLSSVVIVTAISVGATCVCAT